MVTTRAGNQVLLAADDLGYEADRAVRDDRSTVLECSQRRTDLIAEVSGQHRRQPSVQTVDDETTYEVRRPDSHRRHEISLGEQSCGAGLVRWRRDDKRCDIALA